MSSLRLPLAAVLAAVVFAFPAVLVTQDSTAAPAGRSVMAGVFNAEQVARGRSLHRSQCSSCHGAEDYTGEAFAQAWKGQTVFDFLDLIRQTMPEDSPGKLPLNEYVDIVAYVLNLNGYPQGEAELAPDEAVLKAIRIDTIPARP